MINVTLVGNGAVSKHLVEAFSKTKAICVTQVLSGRGDAITTYVQQNDNVDLFIIAISDDALNTVSQKFINSKKLIVHTSGSVGLSQLPPSVRRGIFYPLQTFSKDRHVDFKKVPICIEAENTKDLKLLHRLASSISESVYEISSEQRSKLHLAAVFVNNFTNHLYHIGSEICTENQVPFSILQPLIRETVEKISELPPIDAQTGPAKRADLNTIQKHLEQLKNKTHKTVYQTLTKSIQETYEKL